MGRPPSGNALLYIYQRMSPGGGKRLDVEGETVRPFEFHFVMEGWFAYRYWVVAVLEEVVDSRTRIDEITKNLRSQFFVLPKLLQKEKKSVMWEDESKGLSRMSRIRIERDLAYLLSLFLARLLLYSTCRGIHRDRESAISQTGRPRLPCFLLSAWKSYSLYSRTISCRFRPNFCV